MQSQKTNQIMMKIIYSKILLVLTLFLFVGCSSEPQTTNKLENQISNKLDSLEGDFSVVFKSLSDTSQAVFINEQEMFHAASTMKTPVMIELFRQAEADSFSLDDSVVVENEFRSIVDSSRYKMDIDGDSEAELYDMIGQQRTIRHLIDDMITKSSNLATNILIEKVGAENITKTMRSYGADSIQVLRGVEDIKAYEQGLSNRTTALDEAIIYKQLARGEVVSKKASKEMIEILKRQTFNKIIPAQLPEDVEVAHKTGWITGVNHDVGIVQLSDGRQYVLVLLSKGIENREKVVATFADISRLIYDFVLSK